MTRFSLILSIFVVSCGSRTPGKNSLLAADAQISVLQIDSAVDSLIHRLIQSSALRPEDAPRLRGYLTLRFDSQGGLSSHTDESTIASQLFVFLLDEVRRARVAIGGNDPQQAVSTSAYNILNWFDQAKSGLGTEHRHLPTTQQLGSQFIQYAGRRGFDIHLSTELLTH
jgi:hypothetical protein